jgi:hypothetical protein
MNLKIIVEPEAQSLVFKFFNFIGNVGNTKCKMLYFQET